MTYHVHAFTDILGFTLENLTDTDIKNAEDGDILAWLDGKWINRAPATEAVPTGLAGGGELNIGPGPNDIEVIAGLGVIVDSYTNPIAPPQFQLVDWPQFNEPITAAPAVAGSIVWFSIADSGNPSTPRGGIPVNQGILKQYDTYPGPSLARMEIFLGVAVHNGTEWREVSNPKVVNQAAETLREIATTVLPLTSIISGGEVQELPSFQLEQLEGVVWEQNRNWHIDKSNPNREALPAQSPLQWKYVNRDLSVVGPTTDTVLNDQWDNGGVIETIPGSGNRATIQRLYLDPANNYWLLYGQEIFPDFLTAQANLNAYNPEVPFLLQNSILLGSVIAEKAPADWTDSEANFIPNTGSAGSTGGGTPITNFINLNDTPPSYTGEAGKSVVVNQAETGLEFSTSSGGGYWSPSGDNIYNNNVGNVGINTDTPGATLHVSGLIFTTFDDAGGIQFNGNSTAGVINTIAGVGSFTTTSLETNSNTVSLKTGTNLLNTVERLHITTAGNVGIGTNTPSANLQVVNGLDDTDYAFRVITGHAGSFQFGVRNDGQVIGAGIYEYTTTSEPPNVHVNSQGFLRRSTATAPVGSQNAFVYNNVADMVAANLRIGALVETTGYYAAEDGGGASYTIEDSVSTPLIPVDGFGSHTLANGNIAVLRGDSFSVMQFGAGSGGPADSTARIQSAIDAAKLTNAPLYFDAAETYNFTSVDISGANLYGNGCTLNRTVRGSSPEGLRLIGEYSSLNNFNIIGINGDGANGDIIVRVSSSNCTLRDLHISSAVESTNNASFSRAVYVVTQPDNIVMDGIISVNYRTGARISGGTNLSLSNFDFYKTRIGLNIVRGKFVAVKNGRIWGLSSTLQGNAGENCILIGSSDADFDIEDITVTGVRMEDSGEHALRIGGQTIARRIWITDCSAIRPGSAILVGNPSGTKWQGGCGFKVLGPTAVTPPVQHKDIFFDNLTVEDINEDYGTFPAGHGVGNFAAYQIGLVDGCTVTNCRASVVNNETSCGKGFEIIASTNIRISNVSIEQSYQYALQLYDSPSDGLGYERQIENVLVENSNFILHPGSLVNQVIIATATTYGIKGFHVRDCFVEGGISAYRTEPELVAGVYENFTIDITYTNSDTDDATQTVAAVTGQRIPVGIIRAPDRPLAGGNLMDNGSWHYSTDAATPVNSIRYRTNNTWSFLQ
jgi:hypothetical protein